MNIQLRSSYTVLEKVNVVFHFKGCADALARALWTSRRSNTDLMYKTLYVCIAVFTLDAGLLARSQYPEGPAAGHLDTGFSWFPCVYKRMLRWFPSFQVATTWLSCSPPDLNSLVTFFPYLCTCKITTATG